jgi:hypothetical protein
MRRFLLQEDFAYEPLENFIGYSELSDYLDGNSFGLELWWIVFSRLGMTSVVIN